MPFNIKTEKILSPENCKRIISLGISLKDSISTLEDKCIEDYDATKTYVKNSLVIYNGYIYKTKTVATGDFDENKFEKIGDNLDLLTLDDIKALINLSDEEIASLQSLISTEIRLDKCFSSSDAYNRILNAENECKKFTLEQLAKKAGVVYKVVADTTGVDSTEFLYLISNGSNGYNIYAYIDGSAVKISDTNINLDDYAKLSDLNNYYDKATSDGKYATITTVDGKVDKTSILTTISTTATNKQAYGASVINTELDKKFDKDNILSIIQDTDNSKVFGAKAVYDTFNQKADNINLYEIKEGEKSKHIVIDLPASHSISGKTTRLFVSDNILAIGLQIWNGTILEKDFRTPLINSNHIFIPTKALTPVSANVNFTNGDSSCNYTVINGMCYVNIWSMNITSNLSVETIFNNLPRAKVSAQFILSNAVGSKTVGMGWIGMGTQIIQCNVKLEDGTIKSQGYTRFSYPIDETWIPS